MGVALVIQDVVHATSKINWKEVVIKNIVLQKFSAIRCRLEVLHNNDLIDC